MGVKPDLMLRKEHKLRVFDSWVLRRICGTMEDEVIRVYKTTIIKTSAICTLLIN
jgi:hypothetical protein